MKIDIHTHIMPDKMPNWVKKIRVWRFYSPRAPELQGLYDERRQALPEVEPIVLMPRSELKDMERTGVNKQVLSTIPVLFNYWAKPDDGLETSRFSMIHIADTVSKNPGSFIGIGTVPLQDIGKGH